MIYIAVSSAVDWKHHYAGHISLESGQPQLPLRMFLCTKADVVVMCCYIPILRLVHLVNYINDCRAESEASNCWRGGNSLVVLVISNTLVMAKYGIALLLSVQCVAACLYQVFWA